MDGPDPSLTEEEIWEGLSPSKTSLNPSLPLLTPIRQEVKVHRECVYFIALILVATASGGAILGVSSFGKAMVSARLLDDDGLGYVFDGGFQIMTWLSLVWSICHDRLGPRLCAILGVLCAAGGNAIICLCAMNDVVDLRMYMLGYGLIGGGGNAIFITSFQFANLFNNIGFRCGLLSSFYQFASFLYLFLNIPAVSVPLLFGVFGVYQLIVLVVVAVGFPDTPYKPVDFEMQCTLTWPSFQHLDKFCDCRDLFIVLPVLRQPRFIGFALTFAWCTLSLQWIEGAIFSIDADNVNAEFFAWWLPTLGNATFLFAPLVGSAIDAWGGFSAIGLTLIVVTEVCLASMLFPGHFFPWLTIVTYNMIGSIAYTVQFAYISMTYPPVLFPGLLAAVMLAQGLCGFIAWPILSGLEPFGDVSSNKVKYVSLILIPTAVLWLWPALELLKERRKRWRETKSSCGDGTDNIVAGNMEDPP